jgi:ribosomal-protein-alanine N-acetyltransferase
MALIHAASFDEQQIWSATVLSLQLDLPGAFGLISGDQGFVLARVAGLEAEILTLAVAPAARRRGIAAALVAGAQAYAADIGATEMFLEVATTNEPARALYQTLGFHEVGRRRAYYSNGDDALILKAGLRSQGEIDTTDPIIDLDGAPIGLPRPD